MFTKIIWREQGEEKMREAIGRERGGRGEGERRGRERGYLSAIAMTSVSLDFTISFRTHS